MKKWFSNPHFSRGFSLLSYQNLFGDRWEVFSHSRTLKRLSLTVMIVTDETKYWELRPNLPYHPIHAKAMTDAIATLKQRLAALEAEKTEILAALRRAQVPVEVSAATLQGTPLAKDVPLTNEAKLAFFLRVFAARRDVFPQRWASGARQGYSPVCLREWERGVCLKPQVKCSLCEVRQLQPFDEALSRGQLEGPD